MSQKNIAIYHYLLRLDAPSEIQYVDTKALFNPEGMMGLVMKDGKIFVAAAVDLDAVEDDSFTKEPLEVKGSEFVIVPTGQSIPKAKRAVLVGHQQGFIVNGKIFPCTTQQEANQLGTKRLGFSVFWIKPKSKKKSKKKNK